MNITKLEQIVKEMQNPENYYKQPDRGKQIVMVMPGKQTEWISRLSMIVEGLKEKNI